MLCYWQALAFLWLYSVVLLTEMAPEGAITSKKGVHFKHFFPFFFMFVVLVWAKLPEH